jgi:aminopeptidase N
MRWCLLFFISLSVHAQQVDVQHYRFALTLSDTTDNIHGIAEITARFPANTHSFTLDLTGMKVTAVREKNQPVKYSQDSATLQLSIQPDTLHTFIITYEGIPKDGLIISTNKYDRRTFFSDNWPDRAHQWIPCVDNPADKATVDFIITAPEHYKVVANGLKVKERTTNKFKTTFYTEKIALPTKVMAIGVADFAVDHSGDINGIPIYSYIFPEDQQKGFHDYKMAGKILSYFTKQIGPYPYEKLANVQSKTIFGGMENASAIFYSEESVGSKHIEELLAHEIAHQWFGDAVTETGWQHVWLSEGFATYMTHLYMENKYGVDTLRTGLAADRKKIIAFAKKRQTPVVDTTVNDQYMQLLNANSYEKGGWALHMLRRQVGDSIFWKGIRLYFKTYNGRNANTTDFRKVMERVSGQSLTVFFKQWLETSAIPVLDISYVFKSPILKVIVVKQLQDDLFTFPLEYTVDKSEAFKETIKNRITEIEVPMSGNLGNVQIDQLINLLAEIHNNNNL